MDRERRKGISGRYKHRGPGRPEALQGGYFSDTIKDLGEIGGVMGAAFKLGSLIIPDPTPEQRIATRLFNVLFRSLDQEAKRIPDLLSKANLNDYLKNHGEAVTASALSADFTWLRIFGSRGRLDSRSWPIVGELADLGSRWIQGAAGEPTKRLQVQQAVDDARGRIHEALCLAVDELVAEPSVSRAIEQARPKAMRDALSLLAAETKLLSDYRLLGEIPQSSLYIPPVLKTVDLSDSSAKLEWDEVKGSPLPGDDAIWEAITKGGR